MKLLATALSLIFLFHMASAQEANLQIRVSGRLLERGTKKPLGNASVFILPHKLKAETNDKGEFVFESVPFGQITWVVNLPDYERLEQNDDITANQKEVRLFAQRVSYQSFETTVVGRTQKEDTSVRSLRASQIATLPGAQGDPIKAVQNLPGVNRASGFSSQVIIQGSAPQDTRYILDQHEVPIIFHFGGLSSVVLPEVVDRVDYYSSGYGPEYGRALGGQVGLITRNPTKERWQGYLFADTAKAGAMIEGPVNETDSFLIGGRYSYIGYVLQAVLKNNESFDLTVAPAYSDVTSLYSSKLSDRDEFKVLGVYSHDELAFLFKEPVRADPALRGTFKNTTDFYRVIPQWTRKWDPSLNTLLSVSYGQDWTSVDIGDQYFNLSSQNFSVRSEAKKTLSETWQSTLGIDNRYSRARVNFRLPSFYSDGGVSNPISSGEVIDADVTGNSNAVAIYWRNDAKLERWTLSPSLRGDYFVPTKEYLPSPRATIRYDFDQYWGVYSSGGIYYQVPQPQEFFSPYGNPDLKSSRAYHGTVGQEYDFRQGSSRGFILDSKLFYKSFDRLVIQSSALIERNGENVVEKYNNNGKGRAYGFEAMLRLEAQPWMAWLSYTLSRSTRWQPGRDETIYQYDQTHNINLVGSYDLPRNWKLSSRFRYVTGNPTTPVVGSAYDSDNDVYVPTRGAIYSERLQPFIQLDFRVDKKWIYDTSILWVYLDIQNLTNQKNPENIRYSYDYSQKAEVTGLPVFPTIGVRGEF